MPYLENECERRLLEDTTQRALELGESMARAEMEGFEGIAGTVLTALRCPNFCNGNGQCTEWGCQCYPGHSFYDCSLAISEYSLASCSEIGHNLASKDLILKLDFISLLVILLLSLQH